MDAIITSFSEKSKLINKNSLILPQIALGFLNLTYSQDDLRNSTFGDRVFLISISIQKRSHSLEGPINLISFSEDIFSG